MKWLDRTFDWLETRPLSQICVGVALAFAILVAISECTR